MQKQIILTSILDEEKNYSKSMGPAAVQSWGCQGWYYFIVIDATVMLYSQTKGVKPGGYL